MGKWERTVDVGVTSPNWDMTGKRWEMWKREEDGKRRGRELIVELSDETWIGVEDDLYTRSI